MENNKDLEEFRKQWKYELNRNNLPVDEKSKREPNLTSDDSNCDTDTGKTTDFHHPVFGVEESKKRPNTYQSFLLAEDLLKQDDSQIHETYSSNVLRRKRSSCDLKDLNSSSTSSQDVGLSPEPKVPKSDDKNTVQPKERFLDIFLADLDEINEIPFFDIELPRELALKIFRHLDVAELCHCAQVSRAWRSLAEDEVLWLQLSHQYGYNMENRSTDDLNWKSIFREKQVCQQNLTANWKSRTGMFHEYSYPGGGVLCAVHSHQDYIVAGYTSGEVKFWNTENAEQCLFQASCRALEINEDEDAGTSTNYVTCVRTNHSVTAAGYSQGYVDVWSNETGTSPVHSFRGPGSVNQLELSQSGDQLLAVNNNIIRIEHSMDGQWTQQRMFELPTKVTQADFIENCASTNSGNYVATACEDHLTIYNTRNDDVTIVHNTIGQRVTIFDANDAEILYGTIWYMEPIAKIEVYDFSTQRHTCRVNAHAGPVTCLNLRDSPQHMFVTGGLDRKAMIHDRRINASVMTFNRLNSVPNQVQMDDYKVVCGLDDGMVCVYDQRTTNKLWEFHNRHPVKYLHFKDNLLTTANIPNLKFPQTQPFEEVDNIKHRRYRGNIQLYDFLGEQKTQGVHDICMSTYDEPEQYSYNIRLAVPYDQL